MSTGTSRREYDGNISPKYFDNMYKKKEEQILSKMKTLETELAKKEET